MDIINAGLIRLRLLPPPSRHAHIQTCLWEPTGTFVVCRALAAGAWAATAGAGWASNELVVHSVMEAHSTLANDTNNRCIVSMPDIQHAAAVGEGQTAPSQTRNRSCVYASPAAAIWCLPTPTGLPRFGNLKLCVLCCHLAAAIWCPPTPISPPLPPAWRTGLERQTLADLEARAHPAPTAIKVGG